MVCGVDEEVVEDEGVDVEDREDVAGDKQLVFISWSQDTTCVLY